MKKPVKIALRIFLVLFAFAAIAYVGLIVLILQDNRNEREKFIASISSASDVASVPADEREFIRQRIEYKDAELNTRLWSITAAFWTAWQFPQLFCRSEWDAMWPLAKNGNVLARLQVQHNLFSSRIVVFKADGTSLAFKAGSKYVEYFYFYRRGPAGPLNNWTKDSEPIDRLISGSTTIAHDGRLVDCLRQYNDDSCTDIAVADRVIPSFEEFSHTIDNILRDGGHLECHTLGMP